MISFDVTALIFRPLSQVFTFVATPENDFQWQYGTLASTLMSQGKVGIGTLFRTVSHFMGRRIESVFKVTEFQPNTRYGFTSVSGPVDSRTLYTFEMIGRGTQIMVSTMVDPRDLFEMSDFVIEKKFRKQYKENLAMLKSQLETYRLPTV